MNEGRRRSVQLRELNFFYLVSPQEESYTTGDG
jgi:hypothetical protein